MTIDELIDIAVEAFMPRTSVRIRVDEKNTPCSASVAYVRLWSITRCDRASVLDPRTICWPSMLGGWGFRRRCLRPNDGYRHWRPIYRWRWL